MKIYIRPHHFLCLQGYKGFNYSEPQKHLWNTLTKKLKANPNADIVIITGMDELCKSCPGVKSVRSSCIQNKVRNLDEKVKELLNLKEGGIYKYRNILSKLKETMTFKKHKELCSECCWWKKGLCRDSFEK